MSRKPKSCSNYCDSIIKPSTTKYMSKELKIQTLEQLHNDYINRPHLYSQRAPRRQTWQVTEARLMAENDPRRIRRRRASDANTRRTTAQAADDVAYDTWVNKRPRGTKDHMIEQQAIEIWNKHTRKPSDHLVSWGSSPSPRSRPQIHAFKQN